MIDNGYSLKEMEIVNWGNFHGYQKFSLQQSSGGPGLLAPPQASAILGVNGSGKTTLIDAMMIALLPFENSVKLGVTNDYELGAGGGRSIKDYVLGKYSSSQGAVNDLSGIYGRKTGSSILLLTFQHNENPNRHLCLGRIWWYKSYKVSDTQMGFISLDNLSVKSLCPDGKLPKSPKEFKTHVKNSKYAVESFETMQSYFSSLSGAFGGVSRNDLKLLNRAFYVKSISHIDSFIKENMLLSADNPHLERLLENVKNGQEIASAIEACEKKLHSARRILKELGKIVEVNEKIEVWQSEKSLLYLVPEYEKLEDLKQQEIENSKKIIEAKNLQPDLQRQLSTLELDLSTIRSQLSENDAANQISRLEGEIKHLEEKIKWSQSLFKKWSDKLNHLKIKIPTSSKDISSFKEKLNQKQENLNAHVSDIGSKLEEKRQNYFELEQKAKQLKDEVDHLTRSGSLIPRRIYEIKERAIKELKIPPSDLRFFAELVQVKDECQSYRRPVEAVFFSVARNLLCHPSYLNKLTSWLEKNGFKADITVKRISVPEIEEASTFSDLKSNSILNFIEVLPDNEHPFSNYIYKWCNDVFNYQLVDSKDFKSRENRLVTQQGLLKNDNRTMRKLKRDFQYSLGWDTQAIIELKSKELVECGLAYQREREKILGLEKNQLESSTDLRLINELLSSDDDLSVLCSGESLQFQKNTIAQTLSELKNSQPEIELLKNKLESMLGSERALRKKMASTEMVIEENSKKIEDIKKILPLSEKTFFESDLFVSFIPVFESKEKVVEQVQLRMTNLKKSESTATEQIFKFEAQIKSHVDKKNSISARVGSYLLDHKRNFSDPNVNYQFDGNDIENILHGWKDLEKVLAETELPQAKEQWQKFFNQILINAVKDTLNEIKIRIGDISDNIQSINEVLVLTNFEELPTEHRYLQIVAQSSTDERVRRFRKTMQELESVLGASIRIKEDGQSAAVMSVLVPFVEQFQNEPNYREYVTDVRNHFQFHVHSLRRSSDQEEDQVVETFSGARKDAKSSAQTTQLAYALLASSLAYRFRFHDPVRGKDTPRLIILDEFGGKFDNEKPREIIKLLDKMGFQSILLSPMSKADLLAESIGQMVLVHKLSASESKVKSFEINSLEDYRSLLNLKKQAPINKTQQQVEDVSQRS